MLFYCVVVVFSDLVTMGGGGGEDRHRTYYNLIKTGKETVKNKHF